MAAVTGRMLSLLPAERAAALADGPVTVDLDTTDVEVYGSKKPSVAWNHQGQRVGRPHVAAEAEAETVLAADLGDGTDDPRATAPDLLHRALAALPECSPPGPDAAYGTARRSAPPSPARLLGLDRVPLREVTSPQVVETAGLVLRAAACLAIAHLRRPRPVPGQELIPARRWARVSGVRSALMINGVPVATAPAEIDFTTAEQLRTVLLDAGSHGLATVVVDMTQTRYCDSSGLSVLVRAHRRAVLEGGELRLVLPAGGPVVRVMTLTGLDRIIPCFGRLDQALAAGPPAEASPVHPPLPAGPRSRTSQPGTPG